MLPFPLDVFEGDNIILEWILRLTDDSKDFSTSAAGEGGPVGQRPPQDGLQSLSDGTVNIRTGLADVGGRTGENDIGKLGEGG